MQRFKRVILSSIGWGLIALGAGILGFVVFGTTSASAESFDERAPHFEVDTSWPKELPNNWMVGQIGGLTVDAQDHIWVLQRPGSLSNDELLLGGNPSQAICCTAAPALLEFDLAGNVIRSWGGTGFVSDWPKSEHAIFVDKHGNVWISGQAKGDRQVIEFTPDGKQLLEIGHPSDAPRNNQDTTILGQPAGIFVDDAAREVYIADGYLNNRVVVYDADTGAFKRGWGAYGIALSEIPNDDPPPHVSNAAPTKRWGNPVHGIVISNDGLVYVNDRTGDRVQIFNKNGKYLREFVFHNATLSAGSSFMIAFSPDKAQKYLYLADGSDDVVGIFRRSDGVLLGEFGHKGRNAGQFVSIHQLGVDSKGNIYTGEVTSGKRLQKFVLTASSEK